jgi:alpha-glucuronidase
LQLAIDEVQRAYETLTDQRPAVTRQIVDGALVLASPDCAAFAGVNAGDFDALGRDGYAIDGSLNMPASISMIRGQSDVAVLYGVFDYLMRVARGEQVSNLSVQNAPSVELRILNHWDNLDRHVERGYAGQSIWDWHRLPGYADPRYTDYARANASIGINGTVLTNVNADATVLTAPYLEKVAALADIFRPYGIRVYLTARFSAPIELGGLDTADPLDPRVRKWWQDKADEIYRQIPDFGGFLVKANSEGQPGPQDYGRSHVDGANMLADIVHKHNGYVMWRAFVYSAEEKEDRIKQAYNEFIPLDGKFRENVLIQVKNGPLDFQPREPFHPMFGAMPNTPLMIELQVTKEYLGFSTHLAYLGTLWEEVLSAETYTAAHGATVSEIVKGDDHPRRVSGIAGVANIGTDRNWSGSIFDQANWFAFGRLAWDPERTSQDIASEWTQLTFSTREETTTKIVNIMMASREAVVNYMTPLGLTHLMGTGHHYGPAPWVDNLGRDDWNPVYYHRANTRTIGVDRTENGTNAIAQYAEPLRSLWSAAETTPDEFKLWFHALDWEFRMSDQRTLWEHLVERYDQGVASVINMQNEWEQLEPEIDAARHRQISQFLDIQNKEARWWRDASLAYWMSVNGRALPEGARAPDRSLEDYKSMSFPYAPGQGG